MRGHRNPFRARSSEQLGEPVVFLRNFGPGMLDLVPESIWDRPLLLRSAPGGGKTSLMRLFVIENLRLVDSRREEFPELVERLTGLGALTDEGPTHLGVLLNLDRDYTSLLDLSHSEEQLLQLFFSLLDARIIMAAIRSALEAHGAGQPSRLELVPLGSLSDAEALAEPLGGLNGQGLWDSARDRERSVLRPLDSLLPGESTVESAAALPQLNSLQLLSATRLAIDGRELPERPLIMLDDGHELGPGQRDALLKKLGDRSLQVARWYSERFEALSDDELLVGSTEGRDFELLQLEDRARTTPRYQPVLLDVSNRRARPFLQDYAQVQQSFADLISFDPRDQLQGRDDEILGSLKEALAETTARHQRYAEWWERRKGATGYEGARLLRAMKIVVDADLKRTQGELFEHPLPYEELEKRQSRVMSAAGHFLARDFGLPFYIGTKQLAYLGSENMEQYLRLAGDLFEEMLAKITLKEHPRLDVLQQDRIAHRASERYWSELEQRVPGGRQVRQLAEAIVRLAQADTFRPTAPYAPGVTGTALPMDHRERLLDPEVRAAIPGAEHLFHAIGSGVAHNVFSVELDYAVKNRRVMVIYLNRLMCPRFHLPLGRGGFRERRLEIMASWMTDDPKEHAPLEVHDAAQLML